MSEELALDSDDYHLMLHVHAHFACLNLPLFLSRAHWTEKKLCYEASQSFLTLSKFPGMHTCP
jgi:hypothetical protein